MREFERWLPFSYSWYTRANAAEVARPPAAATSLHRAVEALCRACTPLRYSGGLYCHLLVLWGKDAGSGGARGVHAPFPRFFRSVDPTLTMGGTLCPPKRPSRFFRSSYVPVRYWLLLLLHSSKNLFELGPEKGYQNRHRFMPMYLVSAALPLL